MVSPLVVRPRETPLPAPETPQAPVPVLTHRAHTTHQGSRGAPTLRRVLAEDERGRRAGEAPGQLRQTAGRSGSWWARSRGL